MDPGHVPITFAQAIEQFAKKFNLHQFAAENIGHFTTLCHVLEYPRASVKGWFKRGIPPTAERARKLQLMLSLCGFDSQERKDLNPIMRTFFDTISTVVSVEDAAEEVDGKPKNLLNWVRGTSEPKSFVKIIDFNQRHSHAREAKIKEWRTLLKNSGFITAESHQVAATHVATQVPSPKSVDTSLVDGAITHQAMALHASITSSGVLADDQRRKFVRQGIGHEALAELIGSLQRLLMANYDL